jgi:hypothetical protein
MSGAGCGSVPNLIIVPVAVTPKELTKGTVYNVSVQTPEDKVGWATWSKPLADALEKKLRNPCEVEYTEKDSKGWINRNITSVDGFRPSRPSMNLDLSPVVEELRALRKLLEGVGADQYRTGPRSPAPSPAPTQRAEGGVSSAEAVPVPTGGVDPAPRPPHSDCPPDIPVEIWDAMYGAASGKSKMWRRGMLLGFKSEAGGEWPSLTSPEGVSLLDRIANLASRGLGAE